MNGVTIRPAQDADYDALARIWWQGATPFDGTPTPPALYDEMRARLPREVADNGWRVFAAEAGGHVAGLLAIKPSDGALTELFIDETLRSRGIGKALLDFAKQQMPGGFWLRTHSLNRRGHAFYAREGLAHLRDEPHPRFPETLFRIYAWGPRDSWGDFHRRWSRLKPPLRPNAEVAAGIAAMLEGWRDRVLLLGVTPELSGIAAHTTALDRSADMIAQVWPGDSKTRQAVLGNWLDMPVGGAEFTATIGDGSLNAIAVGQYKLLFAQLARKLRPGARLAMRVYETPEACETVDALRTATMRGDVGGFHALKWRLAMAIAAERHDPDVPVALIHRVFMHEFPDRAALADATGWSLYEIAEIDAYDGAATAYSFPIRREILAALPADFVRPRFVACGTYELAERCPIFVAERAA